MLEFVAGIVRSNGHTMPGKVIAADSGLVSYGLKCRVKGDAGFSLRRGVIGIWAQGSTWLRKCTGPSSRLVLFLLRFATRGQYSQRRSASVVSKKGKNNV